jgi:uncharacterized OB-fold protein
LRFKHYESINDKKRGVSVAVISEVKCGRCDRRYSGFRSRCPYCGARRNKRGKHADEADNAKAKMVIGILALVLLIATSVILVFTSLPDKVDGGNPTDAAAVTTDAEPLNSNGENVTTVENSDDPSESPSLSPSPSAVIEVAEVDILAYGDVTEDFTLKVGESLQMRFATIPETTGKIATWKSSKESVFMVLSDGKLTAIGKGSATLTVTVDGVEATCIVRVKN